MFGGYSLSSAALRFSPAVVIARSLVLSTVLTLPYGLGMWGGYVDLKFLITVLGHLSTGSFEGVNLFIG